MEWIPCEELTGTLGNREGHCATSLREIETKEEWVLCVGGYCEGERDALVIGSKVHQLPQLHWITLSSDTSWFECDGASLTRITDTSAYVFGGLDAAMDRTNRIIELSLHHTENENESKSENSPLLNTREVQTTGDIPLPRTQHSAAATGTNFIIFGGETDSAEQTNELYVLNINTLIWKHIRTTTIAPTPRLLSGPLLFLSSFICVLYGGAHFVKGDIKSLDDVWICDFSRENVWTKIENNSEDNIFPRSNGHAGGVFRKKDGNIAVFVGGKDAAEGCDKVKQIQEINADKNCFHLNMVDPILNGIDGPHWRYTPAVVETPSGLLLLGGQCRHPQDVAAFLLKSM
ncbi:hypothetical protein LSM04_009073 [Trypanosoma melophagium]|uniref:uncharacterized protein n=1 Tax=Trypanosoma melophagium TaxID=715481 RepID=UPI00351A5484|nr:hypothetical protein LSM04_009073 [Trypanosoma melophagium]